MTLTATVEEADWSELGPGPVEIARLLVQPTEASTVLPKELFRIVIDRYGYNMETAQVSMPHTLSQEQQDQIYAAEPTGEFMLAPEGEQIPRMRLSQEIFDQFELLRNARGDYLITVFARQTDQILLLEEIMALLSEIGWTITHESYNHWDWALSERFHPELSLIIVE